MAKRRTHARPVCVGLAVTLAVAVSAALLPSPVRAELPDEHFDCQSDPHTFISSLIDAKSIDPHPSRVEPNSVNAFRPVRGTGLQAFGFPIYAVFGYERDDALFRQGDGKTIDGSVYGVVVSAPAESVRTRVQEANSPATVRPVVPLVLTAIVCDGH